MSAYCKYYKQKKQISSDGGLTWEDAIPYEYREGALYEECSVDCGYPVGYKYVVDGEICEGSNLYELIRRKVTYDTGSTWIDTDVIQLGNLIEENSESCGYKLLVTYTGGRENKVKCEFNDIIDNTDVTKSGTIDRVISADIGECAIKINNGAFYSATSLTNIDISSGITEIGTVGIYYGYIGIGAFGKCTSLSSITMSDNLIIIGDSSFQECSSLTSIDIPSGVTSIGDYAFNGCSSLSSITIPDSVTYLGKYSFGDCIHLENATIGSGITSINDWLFFGCSGLANIDISDNLIGIGNNAFYNCRSLTSVNIPSGVTYIKDSAFRGCSGLSAITINSETPPSLGKNAFVDTNNCPIYVPCSSINLYKSTERWSDYANRIQAIACGTAVKVKYKYQADLEVYCSELETVIPWGNPEGHEYGSSGQVTTEMIDNSSDILSIEIGECSTVLGQNLFKNCGSLTSVTFSEVTSPNSGTTVISGDAFYNCNSIDSIILPDTVEYIGNRAFANCDNLRNVTIGSGITNIGAYAFSGNSNTNLSSVVIYAPTPPTIDVLNDMFGEYNKKTIVYVPSEYLDAYKTAWPIYADRIQAIDIRYRWNTAPSSDYICDDGDKYAKQYYQYSYDGSDWFNVSPEQTRKGDFIESGSPYCYETYLTFVAIDGGTFKFSGSSSLNTVSYSLDNGITWIDLDNSSSSTSYYVRSEEKIMWKGNCEPAIVGYDDYGIGRFTSTGKFNVEGNIMSLLYGDDYHYRTDFSGRTSDLTGAFDHLFNGNTNVVNAENLILPATTLADRCYNGMFNGCTSLTTAPSLSATTLANSCYAFMFRGCNSLTTAPLLPSTKLTYGCYNGMFSGCTSLTTAPELPALYLEDHCYTNMFFDCSSLNYVKAMFITQPTISFTNGWLHNVASTGTFVKNSDACWENSNDIPSGWTVDYETIDYHRWNTAPSSDYICDDGDKYAKQYYQYSYDEINWFNAYPEQTRKGDLVESASTDCSQSNIKLTITYTGGTTHSIECNSSTTLTYQEVNNILPSRGYLKSAEIGNCVTSIGDMAFSGCSALTMVNSIHNGVCNIPSGVTEIGNYVFDGCSGITSVNIPSGVTKISGFRGCDLRKLIIPNTVTKIGVFSDNTHLNYVLMQSTTPPSMYYSFDNTNNCPIYVPAESVETYKTAPYWIIYADRIVGCGEIQHRWNTAPSSDYICDDGDKYAKQYYQWSIDGETWENVVPEQTRKGDLVESASTYCTNYLTFIAKEDSVQFKFIGTSGNNLSYSLDSGSTWNYTSDYTPIIYSGETIMFKKRTIRGTTAVGGIGRFTSTGKFDIEGNIMSLLYGDDYKGETNLLNYTYNYPFVGLFSGDTNVVSAENLILPATTLSTDCYVSMFQGCTSLTTAPDLPATTLAGDCYYSMFQGCTSLTTAPDLPATIITGYCYYNMFKDCTSLTTAPELPATTLAQYCYAYMFDGCSSLNSITCLATDISANGCTTNWVNGVAASGTFVKNENTTWPTGNGGIPSGWTIENA